MQLISTVRRKLRVSRDLAHRVLASAGVRDSPSKVVGDAQEYWATPSSGRWRSDSHWRDSEVFTPLERDVLAYAEAMTRTPPTVTDEMSARLLDVLGAPALVELTTYIALANLYTRSNVALGVESQGLSASCDLKPLAVASTGVPSGSSHG